MTDTYPLVTYQIDIDDPTSARTRHFVKQGTWPWHFPPREGDYIAPDPDLPIAAPIARIIYRPGPGIIQILLVDNSLDPDLAARIDELRHAGFRET